VFRYSFTNQNEKFNPTFTSQFGWEINTPPISRRSWYRTEPTEQSYFKIDNQNLNLLTVIASADKDYFLMRIQNMNPYNNESGNISSEFMKNGSAASVNYLEDEEKKLKLNGDSVKVDLRPNEIATIKISLKKSETVAK
jgi:alpha-mannosidase